MNKRTAFPGIFWVANSIEILERFVFYGIYIGFGIYMEYLGFKASQLGIIQSMFLLFSYGIPIISGSLADRFGFKKMLIVAYLAYLPSVLLLMFTKTFSGIALTMLCIGFAAGMFKPLILGTVRAVTDKTNKTLGFGIFYQMVNIGATVGPVIAGALRTISWHYAFFADAIAIGIMLLVTIFFYKEPPREIGGETLREKFRDIGIALADKKFAMFLILIGLFFWIPLWSFINILALYIENNIDTASLYLFVKGITGSGFANFISKTGEHGIRHILGETIATTAYFIIVFQLPVSWFTEKFKAIPSILSGMAIASIGFIVLAVAYVGSPALVFLGIFLFGIGEMSTAPRIQEYITWMAPREKAGLYVGANFLAFGLGGVLSGITYTSLYGRLNQEGHPEYVWYALAVHYLVGIAVLYFFNKRMGGLKEMEA